ncbi:DsbA family protein [Vibrio panuliri]|uniref:Thioredoxin n=1 Tax=Vibrio panuliri TaxID=1381081 RepID=A0ABX3F7L8_9VIBR|nr:DsbA family protein [Vibrio panuliri]KAB1457721.1 DsbA family protein [Vibrio panuliri]OLQ85796.1 thioredoxin [Vibrio panuliri]
MTKAKLYYVHDPMCSWCWGYQPTWTQIEQSLEEEFSSSLEVHYLVGGLAPDSDEPMTQAMQQQISSYWRKISDYLGTEFNYDFWQNNTPRRSTYPACRAVLAARAQGAEKAMISAIQNAYYLRALNPSDILVLQQLAAELQLDTKQFQDDLQSEQLNQRLLQEIDFARSIGGNSFPSLFLQRDKDVVELPIDYQDKHKTVQQIRAVLTAYPSSQ